MSRMQTWTGHTEGYSRGNLIQFDEEANEEQQGADVGGQQSICHIHVGRNGGDTVCNNCGAGGRAGQGRVRKQQLVEQNCIRVLRVRDCL